MEGRWPYSWCLVGCCHQDLFNIAGGEVLFKARLGDKKVHTFLIGNSLKAIIIAQLEFEHDYYDIIVKPVSRYAMKDSFHAEDGTLSGTFTIGQSGTGNNGNEVILHTLQISRTGA